MENHEMNHDAWVDDRLALLEPQKGWQPNALAAFSRLRSRDRARKRSWIGGAIAASLASVTLLLTLPSSGSCAQPFLGVCLKPAATQSEGAKPLPPATAANYKLSGSPQAPVTLEIYSDYECPACAQFYSETYPLLAVKYVQTGKIRILHRDFPLPQHPYARLAARYANAAGEAGAYEPAVLQLFRTQTEWAHTGNLDAALVPVLPPGIMQKVRSLVGGGSGEATIAVDQAAGYRDNLNQTPTLIIVAKGKREKVAPIPSFNLLKTYLDRLLTP
jgi:protein-disulfide isomerase